MDSHCGAASDRSCFDADDPFVSGRASVPVERQLEAMSGLLWPREMML